MEQRFDYDLFVIGGGSGGVRAARRAAALGRRVAIAEEQQFGGTCVIRGCVPKKLLVYASQFSAAFSEAPAFGWTVPDPDFDWPTLIANKDREIARLEGVYRSNLQKAGVELIEDRAVFRGAHVIELKNGGRRVSAETVLVAVGGRPNRLAELPGAEHCITSDEAFYLRELPRRVVILGGGYIAVEFANIFHGLGAEVTLVFRGEAILRGFESELRAELQRIMEAKGITIRSENTIERVENLEDGTMRATLKSGEAIVAEQVMLAVGRDPNTFDLGCEAAGIELDGKGAIPVDAFSRTSAGNIYAIGDVTDRVQLTPVAIHEAMCFVETVFKNNPTKPDHADIATAVFAQPELGTVGLTEAEAAERFDAVDVYRARFRPMRQTMTGGDEPMLMKLVVDAGSGRVVGAHVLGPDAGEMAQLLGVAVKGRLSKDDFDRTMAVHPTAAEELVTLYEPAYRLQNGRRVDA